MWTQSYPDRGQRKSSCFAKLTHNACSIISNDLFAFILNILARSIEKKYVEQANEIDNRFGEILRYINTHFTDSTYLARSFKKGYGKTVKELRNAGQICST